MQISSAYMPALSAHQHANTPEPSTTAQAEDGSASVSASVSASDPTTDAEQGSLSGREKNQSGNAEQGDRNTEATDADNKSNDPLTDPSSAEYAQIQELAARDTEVRAHEQAHLSAAGQHATSGPTYSYQTGPDGKQYAIGGEVGIDVSAVPDDPEATIAKMEVVQRAATAPAEPSGQDMRVAAQAAQTASAARAELASQQFAEMQGGNSERKATDGDKQAPPEAIQSTTSKQATHSYTEQQGDNESRSFDAVA